MAYIELEEIVNSLETEIKKEKGLKNKVLYESAIKSLQELKERKNKF
jgi:exonuclease VII small subunit